MLQTPLQITVCCPPPLAAPHSPPLPPTSHLTLHLPSPSSPKSVPLASLLYPLPALFFFPSSFSFVLDLPLSPPFNSLFSLSHFLPFFTPPPYFFPAAPPPQSPNSFLHYFATLDLHLSPPFTILFLRLCFSLFTLFTPSSFSSSYTSFYISILFLTPYFLPYSFSFILTVSPPPLLLPFTKLVPLA